MDKEEPGAVGKCSAHTFVAGWKVSPNTFLLPEFCRIPPSAEHQLTAGCRNTVSGNVSVHRDAISHGMWLHEKKMKNTKKNPKTNECLSGYFHAICDLIMDRRRLVNASKWQFFISGLPKKMFQKTTMLPVAVWHFVNVCVLVKWSVNNKVPNIILVMDKKPQKDIKYIE